MVTSRDLIELLKPIIAKARELDQTGEYSHFSRGFLFTEAALALGHSEGIAQFVRLAMHWENDIDDWIRHVEDGLIEA
jgi:hypothetical protein